MSRNDKLIPIAIQAIELKLKNPEGSVNKELEGYVSSFGSSITQSGLLATLSFYTDGEGENRRNPLENTDGRRNRFLQAIMYMIDPQNHTKPLLQYVIDSIYSEGTYRNENFNFAEASPNYKILNKLEEKILECSIALKLALRTYKLKK